MRLFATAGMLVVVLSGHASANGRASRTSSINFRQGRESDVWVGLTFGAVVSHDGGATWYWTCEDAIGYAGITGPGAAGHAGTRRGPS